MFKLPGHPIAGAYVDILIGQPECAELGLDRLGLGHLLGLESRPVQHVQEVGVAPGVELVGPIKPDPPVLEEVGEHAVHDGRSHL
jgi:hypothetical protein